MSDPKTPVMLPPELSTEWPRSEVGMSRELLDVFRSRYGQFAAAAPNALYNSLATAKAKVSMSPLLAQELQQRGVAQAVVILNSSAPSAGLSVSSSPFTDLYNLFIKDSHSRSAVLMAAAAASADAALSTTLNFDQVPAVRHFPKLGVLLGDVGKDGAEALANDQRVRYVASSMSFRLIRPVQSEPAKLSQVKRTTWGVQKLGIEALWNHGLSGKGVRIGHLDTGVDGDHPALSGAIAEFLLTDPNGFEVTGAKAHDTGTHGTHTAGTIAGRPVSGRHIGVAPGAKLYSAAVIEGGLVVQRILAGLEWALDQNVKIISMSLGLPDYQEDFLEVIRKLRSLGVLPVVAAGNEGPGTSRSPGNYEEVLSVGACNEALQVASFSSSDVFAARPGDKIVPDLVGPGVDVISASPGGAYRLDSGTSMATPHIAGLAALLWEAKPSATAAEIETAIFNSCKLEPSMRSARANRGFPNAVRAFEQLMGHALAVTAPRVMIVRKAASKKVTRKPSRKKKSGVKKSAKKKAGGRRR